MANPDPVTPEIGALALLTDLYELKMMQAFAEEGMAGDAVFTLFVRRLPEQRKYLLACGLGPVVDYLETVRFTTDDLSYLATLGIFSDRFLRRLDAFRFTGAVHALPEGMPVLANEPIMEVVAPIEQAQLVETLVMNQVHHQMVVAAKAARCVEAAGGRPVIDFGARRMHGLDAAMKAVRAFWIAGVAATSNVLGARTYGVPASGTMAHSYVQAHDTETDAFLQFARLYPGTIVLVDTYDTLRGVDRVIELTRRHGDGFSISAVRLDSGDLAALAVETRRRLDAAGLNAIQIFASGGLDEHRIADLVRSGAPIDGFGVGTALGVSADRPDLDLVYKLVSYAGRGRLKLSTGKPVLPGRKQVFRVEQDGRAVRDIIGRDGEGLPGRPLMRPVMRGGRRIEGAVAAIHEARELARRETDRLPDRLRTLETGTEPYPVEVSAALREEQERIAADVAASG